MRVETDDELYRVNKVWLGFSPKFSFDWSWRYGDYAVLAVSWFALFLLLRVMGMPLGVMIVGGPLVAAIAITKLVRRCFGYERTLLQWIAQCWHELVLTGNARRPADRTSQRGSYRDPVRVRSTRPAPRARPRHGRRAAAVRVATWLWHRLHRDQNRTTSTAWNSDTQEEES